MQPLQIFRLVTIVLKVATGVTALILFGILSKKVKDESEDDALLSAKEQSQVKIFAVSVISYFAVSLLELILRLQEFLQEVV